MKLITVGLSQTTPSEFKKAKEIVLYNCFEPLKDAVFMPKIETLLETMPKTNKHCWEIVQIISPVKEYPKFNQERRYHTCAKSFFTLFFQTGFFGDKIRKTNAKNVYYTLNKETESLIFLEKLY